MTKRLVWFASLDAAPGCERVTSVDRAGHAADTAQTRRGRAAVIGKSRCVPPPLYRSASDGWAITGLRRPAGPTDGPLSPQIEHSHPLNSRAFVAARRVRRSAASSARRWPGGARNRQPAAGASSGGIKYRHNLLDRMTTLQVLCAICPLQIGPLIEMAKCALMYEKICLARRFSRDLYTGEQWFRLPYLTGAAVATVIGFIEKSYFTKRNISTQCISSFVYSISGIRFGRGSFAGRLGL